MPVQLTEEAEKLIKDNWITHNHPTGKYDTGIRRFGYSLSQYDVVEAIRCNARGIVAESPTYRYMIERPANGWNLNSDNVEHRYNELHKELKRKYQNSINYHPDMAILLQHLVMKQLSKELGFAYLYIKKL